MYQERILAIFSNVINHYVQWISATQYCLFVIELGFQENSTFHTNIGKDMIHKIYVHCCSHNIEKFNTKSIQTQEKPFLIHDKIYHYYMTPFDLRYRVFLLSEHVDNKYRYILKDNDEYFKTVHDIIIFFNYTTGRLGIACDIEHARELFKTKNDKTLSDFYLLHQCCLIIRDLCGMIETIYDKDTSLVPLLLNENGT